MSDDLDKFLEAEGVPRANKGQGHSELSDLDKFLEAEGVSRSSSESSPKSNPVFDLVNMGLDRAAGRLDYEEERKGVREESAESARNRMEGHIEEALDPRGKGDYAQHKEYGERVLQALEDNPGAKESMPWEPINYDFLESVDPGRIPKGVNIPPQRPPRSGVSALDPHKRALMQSSEQKIVDAGQSGGDVLRGPAPKREKGSPVDFTARAALSLLSGPLAFVDRLQSGTEKMVKGEMGLSDLPGHIGKGVWGATFGDGEIPSLGGIYDNAWERTFGTPPSTAVRGFHAILGFAQEFAVIPKIYPKTARVPAAKAIPKNMLSALKKAGIKGDEIGDITRLGEYIQAAKTHPERFTQLSRLTKKIAKKHGVNPAVALDELKRVVGSQGQAMPKQGLARILTRGDPRKLPGGSKYIPESEQLVNPGALAPARGNKLGDFLEEIQYGNRISSGSGTREVLRPGQSIGNIEVADGIRKGIGVEQKLGASSVDYRASRGMLKDTEGILRGAEKRLDKAKAGFESIKGWEDPTNAISRLKKAQSEYSKAKGAHSEARYAFDKKYSSKKTKEVTKFLDDEYARMDKEAKALGFSGDDVEQYVFKGSVPDQGAGQMYAKHRQAMGAAKASMRVESDVLKTYGRPMPSQDVGLAGLHEKMRQQGLVEYSVRVGPEKGKKYLINKGLHHMLDRITNPAKVSDFNRSWQKVMGYWKTMALARPGYVFANMKSDVVQMFGAEANIARSYKDGVNLSRLVRRIEKGQPLGKLGDIKIGKYTAAEVAKKSRMLKVPNTGATAYESQMMSGVGKQSSLNRILPKKLNPGSSENAYVVATRDVARTSENIPRLGIFSDRLRKGFSLEEAAADVAKFFFNYDEVSDAVKYMRNVHPFMIWTWKNWGLQMTQLLTRPHRIAQYERTKRGVEEFSEVFDPLTPHDARNERIMGKGKNRDALIRVGGLREERPGRDARKYFEGLRLPQEALRTILDPLGKGAREVKDSLTPFTVLYDKVRKIGLKVTSPGFFPKGKKTFERSMKRAPSWTRVLVPIGLAEAEYDQDDYEEKLAYATSELNMSTDDAYEYADDNARVVGYMWDKDVEKSIYQIDPLAGTASRIWKGYDDGKIADALSQFLFGQVMQSYGDEEAGIDIRTQIDAVNEEAADAIGDIKSVGKKFDERNPLKSYRR